MESRNWTRVSRRAARLVVLSVSIAGLLCCDRPRPAPAQPAPSQPEPPATAPARESGSDAAVGSAAPSAAPEMSPAVIRTLPQDPTRIAARPYRLIVPPGAADKRPLVLFLHGYGASALVFESALGVSALANTHGVVAALPDGTKDSRGMRYWNASGACCDLDHAGVDDVAYLSAVIADAMSKQSIDPKRVFVLGYSNGGFMAHRLACELGDVIAGVASVAGAGWDGAPECRPASPVTVLQIHGDADRVVRYEGGHVMGKTELQVHLGARATVGAWALRNGCAGALVPGEELDLEDRVDGPETLTASYGGCPSARVALWTVRGGNHFISQKPRGMDAIVRYLLSNPKR